MKIAVIHGSPRKGNTYKALTLFKDALAGEGDVSFVEFTLPQDLPEFCRGCMSCFLNGEETCPHAAYTLPIAKAMLEADALVFTTPVFALQTSGGMKNFLDHYAHMFIVHRAKKEMFGKKAFILATTLGAGTGAALRTIATSLKFWGVNRIYTRGLALHGMWADLPPSKQAKLKSKIQAAAKAFNNEVRGGKKRPPYLLTWGMFYMSRMMMRTYDEASSLDKRYWLENNWFKSTPFKKS
ncbi:MAG: NAD(P)H-dependent oxidoreductase [Christensenellaceae bacterium]|jgi:multimeric flavodoxin WrbA|nr:NAD(P)H-dependent oxidoreductase [Christensenellaceae bacterium]